MDIVKLVRKALSDDDVRRILGRRAKILEHKALGSYLSLDDILPNLLGYALILHEECENNGHWVGLLKHNDTYEFFDPIRAHP